MNEQYSNLKSRHLYPQPQSGGAAASSSNNTPNPTAAGVAANIGAAAAVSPTNSAASAIVAPSGDDALSLLEDKFPEGWGLLLFSLSLCLLDYCTRSLQFIQIHQINQVRKRIIEAFDCIFCSCF